MLARRRPIYDCAARPIFVVRRSKSSAVTMSEPSSPPDGVGTLPQRALRTFREQGPRATASKVRAALGKRRVVVIYRLQREQVLRRATTAPGVTVKSLTESDIPAYLGMRVPYTEEMVAARLRAGDSCIAAWLEGLMVGARWVTTAGADIGPLEISFPVWPGIAYAYDAFTAPAQRGRGIGAMLTAALFESASSAGAIHVINAVLPWSSGQALARGRSEMLGIVSAKNLGPWLIVRCQLPRGYLGAPLPMGARVPNRVSS